MKKITAIAFIAITLISCKKETAKITKIDEKTGKVITIEVPKDSVQEVKANPAIKDSLGVYKQSFKLEKGKTYPLTTYQRDVQTLTASNGKSQSGTNETTDEMTFVVDNVTNKVYDITINLISKRNSQSAQGKTIVVDTKLAAPKEDQLKMMWTVNKALVGNKLSMKMDESGNVLSITGFEPVYTKVNAAVSGLVKDPKARSGFLENFKHSFDEKMLKDQFVKNLKLIPAKGVKIGEKWTNTENATPDGKVKLTTTYTLKSVGNGIATISVTGGIPYKSEQNSQQGITHSMSSELTQNGTILLDQNTGWIDHQNISVKTTQTETMSDGKQKQSMTSVSNSSVMVNPKSK